MYDDFGASDCFLVLASQSLYLYAIYMEGQKNLFLV